MNANRWLPPRPVARRPRRTQRPWLKGGFSAKLQVGARRQGSPSLPFRGPWLASANASLAGWAWPGREPGQYPDDLATPRETIDDQIPLRARSAHQVWMEHLGGPPTSIRASAALGVSGLIRMGPGGLIPRGPGMCARRCRRVVARVAGSFGRAVWRRRDLKGWAGRFVFGSSPRGAAADGPARSITQT